LDDVEKIGNIVSHYSMINDPSHKKQIGVIAQQLLEISPGLVKTKDDGFHSVNYSAMMMKGFKATGELITEVKGHTVKINDIERKIEKMEEEIAELRNAA